MLILYFSIGTLFAIKWSKTMQYIRKPQNKAVSLIKLNFSKFLNTDNKCKYNNKNINVMTGD